MMILIYCSMMVSTSILFMSHPMSLGMMLMIQSIIMSLISSTMFLNSWYAFIMFLVLIGGMMILFMYMTSIASNEKFYLKKSMVMFMLMSILMALMLKNKFFLSMETIKTELSKNNMSDLKFMFNKIMNKPFNLTYMFLFIYLLITMIATIKITKFNSGPLRQMK